MRSRGVRMSGKSAKRAPIAPEGAHPIDCVVISCHSPLCVSAEHRTARWSGRMLSFYRHGVACTLLFANAVLNVSAYLVRQSSIAVLDRGCKVVEPCGRHRKVAIDARDAGTLEDVQSL